jgi:hypothetical protein
MFRINTKTCQEFTLAEIFIMAAMNVETFRVTSGARVRPNAEKIREGFACATQNGGNL